jgi:hypothetical protein
MITYRLKGLPDGTEPDQEFEFFVETLPQPPQVRIPGELRGPDVCIADSPAQERWLNTRPDLVVQRWDCLWEVVGAEAMRRLVWLLASLTRARGGSIRYS